MIRWKKYKRYIFIIISAVFLYYLFNREISERNRFVREQKELIDKLTQALKEIKTLRGILPICSYCKKIRIDEGYWQSVEAYLRDHSKIELSHGICPSCAEKVLSEFHND